MYNERSKLINIPKQNSDISIIKVGAVKHEAM